jgi:hypothetical protein
MGVQILVGYQRGSNIDMACMFDSVTDTVFGPVFYDIKDITAGEVGARFLDWHLEKYGDPRKAIGKELQDRYAEFREERNLIE